MRKLLEVLESYLYQKYNATEKLSEQQMIDCAGNKGCDGAFLSRAANYVKKYGIMTAAGYKALTGDKCLNAQKKSVLINFAVPEWYTIPGDEYLMANVILKYGMITACLDAGPLQFYESGIVESRECKDQPDHAIDLVGYAYNATTRQFYWICRNSWGNY